MIVCIAFIVCWLQIKQNFIFPYPELTQNVHTVSSLCSAGWPDLLWSTTENANTYSNVSLLMFNMKKMRS